MAGEPDGSSGQWATTCHDEGSSEIVFLYITDMVRIKMKGYYNLKICTYLINDDFSSAPGSSLREWTIKWLGVAEI